MNLIAIEFHFLGLIWLKRIKLSVQTQHWCHRVLWGRTGKLTYFCLHNDWRGHCVYREVLTSEWWDDWPYLSAHAPSVWQQCVHLSDSQGILVISNLQNLSLKLVSACLAKPCYCQTAEAPMAATTWILSNMKKKKEENRSHAILLRTPLYPEGRTNNLFLRHIFIILRTFLQTIFPPAN